MIVAVSALTCSSRLEVFCRDWTSTNYERQLSGSNAPTKLNEIGALNIGKHAGPFVVEEDKLTPSCWPVPPEVQEIEGRSANCTDQSNTSQHCDRDLPPGFGSSLANDERGDAEAGTRATQS